MPTAFPSVFNNFEMTLIEDYIGGPTVGYAMDRMTVSMADINRLQAQWAATGYISYPDFPGSCSVKFTAIAPGALDSLGRLVDVTKTAIFFGATDFTSGVLDVRLAYDNLTTGQVGLGCEGPVPVPIPNFPTGSILRCEPTAGLFTAIFKAIRLIEAVTGTALPD
jgi:hypothetical protein